MSNMVAPHRHYTVNGANEDNNIDIGYYIHRNKLGEGGFACVRLATHLKTREKVAIKMMDKKRLAGDLFRVETEIKALKALQHENIAKLLQVIDTEQHIYLVLEYCSGGELFDYLVSKSRLSEAETKIILRDLANALAFMHANGFAHRDLKPENILFDDNHKIKLIDFGLSANGRSLNTSLAHLKTCCGSPAYAAPELLAGNSYSGCAVDVWSAGVLLYALLVGKLPFDDENITKLYHKIQTGIYYLPNWLSKDARDLIQSMLKINPSERITVTNMLKHAWINNGIANNSSMITHIQRYNFDEEILWECHKIFPSLTMLQLRQSIINKFGYHTATYWLLKNKANKIKAVTMVGPSIAHNAPSTENNLKDDQLRINNNIISEKRNDVRPRLIGAKRKILDCEHSSTAYGNNLIKEMPTNIEIKLKPKLANIEVASPSKIPIFVANTPKLTETTKECTKESPMKKAKLEIVKSPLRDSNFKREEFKTPTEAKIINTPKKSLFKRFLETATPSKSLQPRVLTTSAMSKNVTLTSFIDPQLCLNALIDSLSAKGVQCKQKNFSLRCVVSLNHLSFNLEVCKFNGHCVIQRKRLKGDAWHYKRICEEILRISNE